MPGLAIVIGCFLDDLLERRDGRAAAAVALVGVPLLVLVTVDLVGGEERRAALHLAVLVRLHQHAQGPPLAGACFTRATFIVFVVVFALATIALAVRGACGAGPPGRLCAAAVLFTFFLLDGYMRRGRAVLVAEGADRDLLRKSPLARREADGYQMYWRGEKFYTKNEIYDGPTEERTVFLGRRNDEKFKAWIAKHRGHRAFFLFERANWSRLDGMVPPETKGTLKITDDSNMKFVLGQVDL